MPAAWPFVLATLLLLLAAGGGRAAEAPQPGRFLLVFETSPVLKKNLPQVKQTLGKLFASNLQNEIQDNDDLAVWTVDQNLHTGAFPLASWSPADAEMYADRLNDFLDQQHFTRHASLANVQPLLNRLAKNSERLTVLIFCDSQSRLLGTPYDSGVNEIITNAATRAKGTSAPFILVLRAYHGEYLGCSVNRSGTLNFPKFPPPPKPEPPPVAKPAVVPAPPPVLRPVATPVPALIIVGTNASTDVSALTKPASAPASAPAPAPIPTPPATNAAPTNGADAIHSPNGTNAAVSAPAPARPSSTNPAPAPQPARFSPSAPAPEAVYTPDKAVATSAPVAPPSNAALAAAKKPPADRGSRWPLAMGGGVLTVAALVIWLVSLARRPRSSLITRSMQEDLRRPRK